MKTIMVYSETGGATKTTTAVSLAYSAAQAGQRTLLIDLDPRGATTKWTGVEPDEDWQTVAAIIGNENPEGWVTEFALPSQWNENLFIIPSHRELSQNERDTAPYIELRLMTSLEGAEFDLVVIDCPNRQGGTLTQNALAASDGVIYASTPGQDGVDGVAGARESVAKFIESRQKIKAPTNLREIGIVLGRWPDTVTRKVATAAREDLESTGLLLAPYIPERTIVEQCRMSGDWYGDYEKGQLVAQQYADLYRQIAPVIFG
ncbi:ParA family protein [uncultured Corynebacterium sp.]|uniref:ParA family protein n=1 Tax=uncultured Corynebacterium sp. TaxID=159447 RepID=UPI0026395637|nr:ParA family protein [uncultured Corynebacterium sp.]